MFVNTMPRYEILSEDAMAVLDKGWRRLVSEIGVEFLSDRALDLFRAAGQAVEGNQVRFDPGASGTVKVTLVAFPPGAGSAIVGTASGTPLFSTTNPAMPPP